LVFECLDIALFVSRNTGMLVVQLVAKSNKSHTEDQRLCLYLGQRM
jgi:hypothetical protein